MIERDVVVYTRKGCHLCEEALAVLAEQGISPKLVEIDQDAELRQQYHECVPVVVIDGKVRFRGKVNPHLLRRLLQQC